jgi:hypothetical protein
MPSPQGASQALLVKVQSTSVNDDIVSFRRGDLFTMLGEVALPPGSGAPEHTDCAPLAERIVAKVEEYRTK